MRCRSFGRMDTQQDFMVTMPFEKSKHPEATKVDPRFIEGLYLFNLKEYFECHEVIEGLWLKTPVDDKYRDLYKGVIQVAASLYQYDRQIHSGAKGLHKTAVGYLEKYSPVALGLNVRKLIEQINAYYSDPSNTPKPVLVYEPSPSSGHGHGGAG